MSSREIVARSGKLGLTAEQMQGLARHMGLPDTTPVAEIAAEINGTPIAASHANRAAKRDKVIAAAIADGRVFRLHQGEVVNAYSRAPRGLEQSLKLRPSAPAGVKKPSRPALALAASSPADQGVVADPASGALSWNGLPVTPGSDGTPMVHTVNGAMSVAAFKAAGLDAETERVAVGLSHLMGSAAKTGLPRRNPLFGGS